MKAIRVTEYGGPEVLRLVDVETPEPGELDVRMRVAAAGLNFVDIYQRRGDYPMPLPYTPGHEGAGIVEALGKGVEGIKPGDRVAWSSSLGAYAEQCIVPAD